MEEDKCPVDLGSDEKEGWKIHVKGDCDKVLKDVKKHLGEYGTRYFERRLVFDEPLAEPPAEQASIEPNETKVEEAHKENIDK